MIVVRIRRHQRDRQYLHLISALHQIRLILCWERRSSLLLLESATLAAQAKSLLALQALVPYLKEDEDEIEDEVAEGNSILCGAAVFEDNGVYIHPSRAARSFANLPEVDTFFLQRAKVRRRLHCSFGRNNRAYDCRRKPRGLPVGRVSLRSPPSKPHFGIRALARDANSIHSGFSQRCRSRSHAGASFKSSMVNRPAGGLTAAADIKFVRTRRRTFLVD
jgi:hypothetical protein